MFTGLIETTGRIDALDRNEQGGRLRNTANDAYSQASEKVSQMVDRGREAYERARGGTGTGTGFGGASGGNTGTGSSGTGSMSGSGVGAGPSGYGSDRG